MRALTHSTSVPMIAGLLAEHGFEDFECVFGHGGILSREAEDILRANSLPAPCSPGTGRTPKSKPACGGG